MGPLLEPVLGKMFKKPEVGKAPMFVKTDIFKRHQQNKEL